jgi:hypothetical protein
VFITILAAFDIVALIIVARARPSGSHFTGVVFALTNMVVSLMVVVVLYASTSPLSGSSGYLLTMQCLVLILNFLAALVGYHLSKQPRAASEARRFFVNYDPITPALATVPMILLTFFPMYAGLTHPVNNSSSIDQEASAVASGIEKLTAPNSVPDSAQVSVDLEQISSGNVTLSETASSATSARYTVIISRDSAQACITFTPGAWTVSPGACTTSQS